MSRHGWNGRSPVWGPYTVEANPKSILLEISLASEELFAINAPESPPTYLGDDGRKSWIDVSVVSVELLEQVFHWHVEEGAGLG